MWSTGGFKCEFVGELHMIQSIATSSSSDPKRCPDFWRPVLMCFFFPPLCHNLETPRLTFPYPGYVARMATSSIFSQDTVVEQRGFPEQPHSSNLALQSYSTYPVPPPPILSQHLSCAPIRNVHKPREQPGWNRIPALVKEMQADWEFKTSLSYIVSLKPA